MEKRTSLHSTAQCRMQRAQLVRELNSKPFPIHTEGRTCVPQLSSYCMAMCPCPHTSMHTKYIFKNVKHKTTRQPPCLTRVPHHSASLPRCRPDLPSASSSPGLGSLFLLGPHSWVQVVGPPKVYLIVYKKGETFLDVSQEKQMADSIEGECLSFLSLTGHLQNVSLSSSHGQMSFSTCKTRSFPQGRGTAPAFPEQGTEAPWCLLVLCFLLSGKRIPLRSDGHQGLPGGLSLL